MGLLQRIFNWKRDYEEAYEVEEWNEIVYDRDDLQVHNRKQREEYVRGCLEQIAEASREVENLQHEYQVVTSHLKDIEEIEALPENESRLLMECAKRIDTLERQQSGYKERKNRMTDEKFYHQNSRWMRRPSIGTTISSIMMVKWLTLSLLLLSQSLWVPKR